MEAAAGRLKSHLAKLATGGSPQQIVQVGRKAEYVTSLSRELGDQALEQEAAYYVSEYASPEVGAQASPQIEIPKIVAKDGKDKIGQPARSSASRTLQGTDQAAGSSAELAGQTPNLKIYLNTKEVEANGIRGGFKGKFEFNVLRLFAQRFSNGITSADLNREVKRLGSATKGPVVIFGINTKFKKEFSIDQLIVPEGESLKKRTYRLNANVEFVGEETKPAAGQSDATEAAKGKEKKKRAKRDPRSIKMPDGKYIKVAAKQERDVVKALAGSSKSRPISVAEIAREVFGENTEKNRVKVRPLITKGRKTLEARRWKVNVKHAGKGTGKKEARYCLEKLPPRESPPKLEDRHLKAIELLMDKADPEDVIKALGKTRKGKDYIKHQAMWAIGKAINWLVARKNRNFLKEDELKVYKRFSGLLADAGLSDANWRELRQDLLMRLKPDVKDIGESKAFEEAQEKVEALSLDEAAFYIAFLNQRKDLLDKYGFDPIPQSLARRIISRIDMPIRERGEELEAYKKKVFGKALAIVRTDDVSSLYDEEEDQDLQDLLIHMTPTESQNLDFLKEIMKEPVNGYGQRALSEIETVWNAVKQEEHQDIAGSMQQRESYGGKMTERDRKMFLEGLRVVRGAGFELPVSPDAAKKMFRDVPGELFDEVVRPKMDRKGQATFDLDRLVLAVVLSKLPVLPNARGVGHLRKKVAFFVNEKKKAVS